MDNLLLLSDSYKISHWKQYPPKTETVYSYFESRGGKFNQVTFFGLQYCIKKYLEGRVVTKQKIDQAEKIWNEHFGYKVFNRKGWEHILEKHDGRLPIKIKAVREGSVVPVKNVLMTIENTDPECFWLTNFLETLLMQSCWYASTVATQSREIKKLLLQYAYETGDLEGVSFKLHDFGFRGVSSTESAALGGAAHLINFLGTDTMAGILCAMEYYNADVCGFSIPATEHSTITSWGRENEVKAYENVLDSYPTGLVACVSDSYDIYKACSDYWGGILKDKVLTRDGTLIIRPDSGSPPIMVLDVLDILGENFGYETNEKGYKVLNPKVRVIQGDGVNYEMIDNILRTMEFHGWSVDNIAFGMGGALLQQLDRDTQKFAFKCSSITIDGKEQDVYKDPVSDPGKVSKKGRLALERVHGFTYTTVSQNSVNGLKDELVTVFENGELLEEYTFDEVRDMSKVPSLF